MSDTPDVTMADVAMPDSATPDSATPDSATPDSATPDSATPDSAIFASAGQPATAYGLPDDEIAAELPVFLTHRLAKNLHMLVYPQKEQVTKPGLINPTVARIKPIHRQIELDIPLDVQSPMYNRERGRELGEGISDVGRLLDIQTLVSVNIPKNSTYLAAVVRAGEVHLTPVESLTQLRPSLKYLDRLAEKQKEASKIHDDNEDADADDEKDKEAKAQTIQVTVRSAEAEEAMRQQQNSIAYIQQKLEEEPWSNLIYHDVGSEESSLVAEKLVASNRESLLCKTTPDEYLTNVIGNMNPDIL